MASRARFIVCCICCWRASSPPHRSGALPADGGEGEKPARLSHFPTSPPPAHKSFTSSPPSWQPKPPTHINAPPILSLSPVIDPAFHPKCFSLSPNPVTSCLWMRPPTPGSTASPAPPFMPCLLDRSTHKRPTRMQRTNKKRNTKTRSKTHGLNTQLDTMMPLMQYEAQMHKQIRASIPSSCSGPRRVIKN